MYSEPPIERHFCSPEGPLEPTYVKSNRFQVMEPKVSALFFLLAVAGDPSTEVGNAVMAGM